MNIVEFPLFVSPVSAGFPTDAGNDVDRSLNLNDYLIQHPQATFFVRATGSSMIGAGIHSGDILVVDRALDPKDGDIVIAVVHGEFTVKRMKKNEKGLFLQAENPQFRAIKITEEHDVRIWGVVTYSIHSLRR